MDLEDFERETDHEEKEEVLRCNRAFYQDAVAIIRRNKTERNKRRRLAVSLSSACAVVLVVFCSVFFPLYGQNRPQIPAYYSDNIKNQTIEWKNWGEDSLEFTFALAEKYTTKTVEYMYDTVSNDKLYYHLVTVSDDLLIRAEIWLYINPYYRDDFHQIVQGETFEFNSLSLIYLEKQEVQDDIYSYNTVGKIEQGNELIYISYSETSLEVSSNFTQFMSELVGKK